MSSIALSFNNVDLTPIDNGDGQIWVTSKQLAEALEYKRLDTVSRIYSRNADEFGSNMTALIKNPHNVNLTVRVFSLRGCHLVAMFASTDIAKKFRKWVLDVLDAHVANEPIYKLGDLQRLSDEVDAEYAIGFSMASSGGKVMNNWKGKKSHLEARKAVIKELMQPMLPNLEVLK